MERGLMMLLHAIIIAVIIYLILFHAAGNAQSTAEDRSIALGALVLLYMVAFGHGMPKGLNPNLKLW